MGNAGGVGLKGGNNLLAGLGSAVAEQMLAKNARLPQSASLHAQRFNKELFLDNYNPHAMPGFTGNVRRLR